MAHVKRHPLTTFFVLLLALVWTVVAILVIAITGPTHLSRKHRKQEEALPDAETVLSKEGM